MGSIYAYWMKTEAVSLKGKDIWRAIWEYKTENYTSYKDGFRMIAFIARDIRGTPLLAVSRRYWAKTTSLAYKEL